MLKEYKIDLVHHIDGKLFKAVNKEEIVNKENNVTFLPNSFMSFLLFDRLFLINLSDDFIEELNTKYLKHPIEGSWNELEYINDLEKLCYHVQYFKEIKIK